MEPLSLALSLAQSQVAEAKLLLKHLMDGGAIECLVSFMAVEAGGLRSRLAVMGSQMTGVLSDMAERVR